MRTFIFSKDQMNAIRDCLENYLDGSDSNSCNSQEWAEIDEFITYLNNHSADASITVSY